MIDTNRVRVIAEVGGNHNGDFDKAVEMTRAAAKCGVDVVKFQIYIPDKLVHPSQKPHPILKDKYKSQLERYESLIFTVSQVEELKRLCVEVGVEFMATPFDKESTDLLDPMVGCFKISSGDINNIDMLEHIIAKDKPVIISTGMATLKEIDLVCGLVPKGRLTLLHCVSLYPTPPNRVNLGAITFLKQRYPDIKIGYSDHTEGITACLGAVALGASVIEKHFTFDKSIAYGDHLLSTDYGDMLEMVMRIRELEKMLAGDGVERSPEELEKRGFFRRGIYAARDLSAGQAVTVRDVSLVRPPTEIGAEDIRLVIGKKLKSDIPKDSELSWKDLL